LSPLSIILYCMNKGSNPPPTKLWCNYAPNWVQ
jgi:hypothetical protein